MKRRRIVVTGMGLVSCFGNEVEPFYQSLLEGKSGVKPIEHFPVAEASTRFAASIVGFDPGDYMEKKTARRTDPYIRYAMVAGKKALQNARLFTPEELEKTDKTRVGVIVGSGMGGMQVFCDGVQSYTEKGYKRVNPFFVPFIITNMAGALIAKDMGFMGPNYSISTACATSNNSIVAAANHIRSGEADIMVTGGVEAAIQELGLAGFCAIGALSERNDDPQKASRPWDKARDGFVMGEGAGVLVLEELEHALKRGATIYGEYLGGGLSCDAYHMTDPHPEGLGVALCIKKALEDAELAPEQISYVNAHATSTPVGDMAEVRAMHKIFKHPENIVMNSTKSMVGHCLGAAGGIEAIAVIKAIETGIVHPNINLDNPEDGIGFQLPTEPKKMEIQAALSNSFGFGGHNASVIFAPYHK